jgi:hypothetical protein
VGAPQSEKDATILVSQLQALGIDATVNAFHRPSQSAMERALLPGLVLGQSGRREFGDGFLVFRSTDIPTAENRWFGINRDLANFRSALSALAGSSGEEAFYPAIAPWAFQGRSNRTIAPMRSSWARQRGHYGPSIA